MANEVNNTDLESRADTARWVPPSSPAEDIGQRGTLKIGDKVASGSPCMPRSAPLECVATPPGWTESRAETCRPRSLTSPRTAPWRN